MNDTAGLLLAIQNGLASNDALAGWCLEQFGRTPTVQLDFNDHKITRPVETPLISINKIRNSGALGKHINQYQLVLEVVVASNEVDENGRVTTESGHQVRTVTYQGRLLAEEFRDRVIAVLYGLYLGQLEYGSDSLGYTEHPNYHSPFTIQITQSV